MTSSIVQSPLAARAAAGLPGAAIDVAMSDLRQAQFHLDALFGRHRGSLIELRSTRPGGGMDQAFLTLTHQAAQAAVERGLERDVYVGVLPRTRRKGGKDAVHPQAFTVWAECDTETSVNNALDFHIHPHLIIRSSPSKAHCYWFLRTPLSPDMVERANKRLCFSLGADKASTDSARILRVAGTRNHKYGEPLRVSITQVGEALNVMPSALVGDLPDPRPPRVITRPARPRAFAHDMAKDGLLNVPARVYIEALSGRGVVRDMCQCPFHNGGGERTPSLHVGGTSETLWHCFGCDEGGDIFTLAAKLWGLDVQRDFPEIKTKLLASRLA